MKLSLSILASLAFLLSSVVCLTHVTPPPVSFSKQVLPLLQKECMGCHSGPNPASGYSLISRELLLKGGRHGVAIVPGKGAQSSLIRYLTGENKPKMPPGGAIDMDKIVLLRRWIDEGAKVDSYNATLPAETKGRETEGAKGRITHSAPVTAMALSPDGNLLAVGGYRVVRLVNPATGEIVKTILGMADQVQSLAWSSDGKMLAAGGGQPGVGGGVLLFDTQTWKPLRTLSEHTEVVYAVAWKPNTSELATGSLDKTVRVWEANTGKCTRVSSDYADAVFSVAYSNDGKYFASACADRSAKLYDTATWKRLASLTAHQDAVTRVLFSPDSSKLITAGADKTMRVWQIKIGQMENPQRTQSEGDIINALAYSPDGNLLVWGAANHVVKVFNGDGTQQKRDFHDPEDWVYCVVVAKDNQTVIAGTQDGKLYFWDVKEGKLLRTVNLKN